MRVLLVFGLVCFGAGCYLYTPLTNQWGWQELLLPQALRGIGQQFAVPPIVTMALGSLPQSRLKSASGLFNLMRNLGGAIGIARQRDDAQRPAESPLSAAERERDGRPAGSRRRCSRAVPAISRRVAGDALDASQAGLASLHALVMREALVLTFADCFYVLALCFLVGIVSVVFSRPIASAPPSSDAH